MNYDEDFFNQLDKESRFNFQLGDHIDHKHLHGTIIKDNGMSYIIKCDKCGYEYKRAYNQVIRGLGCGVCNSSIVKKGVNDIPTTAPWMVKYFLGGEQEASNYTNQSGTKIRPICPFCGRQKEKPISIGNIYNKKGFSCACNDKISMPIR